MLQEDLKNFSPYIYSKLRNNPFCAKCGRIIDKSDSIEHIKIKHFRGRVEHKFYHSWCAPVFNHEEVLR